MKNAVVLFSGYMRITDIKSTEYSIVESYDMLPPNWFPSRWKIDTIIILDNYFIGKSYIISIIQKALENGYNVVSYFKLSFSEKEYIIRFANEKNVCIKFKDDNVYLQGKINRINIPVFFISGMGEYCSQMETHLLLNKVLKKHNFTPLNITNSQLGEIYGFYNLDSILSENNSFILGQSGLFIQTINHWIYQKVVNSKSNVIIISDEMGIFPYDEWRVNDFGIFNSIMRYACPYDYVLYNLYSKEYSREEISRIVDRVKNHTNTNSVQLGLSHTATAITLSGLHTNDGYFNLIEEEYNTLLNDLKKCFDTINTCLITDIQSYIDNLIV